MGYIYGDYRSIKPVRNNPIEEIVKFIKSEDKFLIISHSEPDGDAVGSMYAMGFILDFLGKEFFIVAPEIPGTYSWLKPPKGSIPDIEGINFRCVIFLDCSNIQRVKRFEEILRRQSVVINIDHHIDNSLFGHINWVDSTRSSVGEMVAIIANKLNIPIVKELAEAIFLAIISDTGSFSYGNTTPTSLRIAADILENGFDLNRFTANMSRQWTIEKAHLHGMALVNSKVVLNGRVGLIKVSQNMLREANATVEDCVGLVNYMRQIKGVLVAVSLREEEDGRVKFSLRSWGEVNVQKIASELGGGGHPNASGGRLKFSLDEAEHVLLKVISKSLPA